MENVKSIEEVFNSNELIGKKVQYGEKESIVSKITKASFVVFENGDKYPIEDLIMMDALVFVEEEIEKEKSTKNNTENIYNLVGKKLYYKDEFETKEINIDSSSIDRDDSLLLSTNDEDEFYISVEKNQIDNFLKNKLIKHDEDGIKFEFKLMDSKEEKPTENKMDQFIFMYYVVKNKSKVLSGHQYKEDANDEYSDRKEVGETLIEVMSRRDIEKLGLDLSDNSIWETDFHDWNIIEEAVKFGVTEGDYQEADAELYIKGFKENGKYSHVIKARLIYFLRHSQRHLLQAFSNSQIDKASTFIEKCTASEMELMRMLKSE